MKERNIIRAALHDAAEWQDSIAAAWHAGDPQRAAAEERAARYRALLVKYYGPAEIEPDPVFAAATPVSIFDLPRNDAPSEFGKKKP